LPVTGPRRASYRPGSHIAAGISALRFFVMTVITNPASPGAPTQIGAVEPVRDPIGGVAFTNRVTNPAVAIFPTTTISPVDHALVDRVGNPMNRQPR
jgi:hypothetical protein